MTRTILAVALLLVASPAWADSDPRRVATEALERLREGEGRFRPDEEIPNEEEFEDAGAERDGFDADELRAPEALEEEVARRAERESPPDFSTASLPTGEDRSAVTPQIIPLPSGEGKLEGMGESFAPQLNTGTATFTVPIAVPPGRAGAQPGLALTYSSSGGNGPVGIGWDLAVPFIARQIDKGMPTYRDPLGGYANDRFKYNGGQELVQVTEPASGETFQLPNINTCTAGGGRCGANDWLYFRARVEGAFLRFFMRGDGRQWRVQDKNGTWFYFGVVDDHPDVAASRTEASLVSFEMDDGTRTAAEVVYRWNLTRMTDANGNDVWYFYDKDLGQSYLRHIYWNAPVATPRTPERFEHHVELVYDRTGRQDVFGGYATGFPLTTAWRLHRIIVESVPFEALPGAGFAHTRTYLLTYDPDSFLSLLTSVQLFGKDCLEDRRDRVVTSESGCAVVDNTALPALTFGYTEVASGAWADGFGYINDVVEAFAASPDRSIDDDRTDLFDANRDGLPDLLMTDPARCSGGHCLYINETDSSGRVSMIRTRSDVDLPLSVGADFTMSNTNVNPLDIDADGAVEWMHMPHLRWYRYFRLEHDDAPPSGSRFWLDGYRWQEYGPFDPGTVDADIDFTRDADDIRLADINNDHLVDVVRTTGTTMQHWLNLSRCGVEYEGRFGTPMVDSRGQCIGAETDGSGRDVPISTCVLHRGLPVQFSNGDTRLADMNGDGLQDIVHLRSGDIAYWPGRGWIAGQPEQALWGISQERDACRASTYGGDLEQTMTRSPHILTIEDDARVMMADVNADGLSDLVQVRFNAVDVWLNLGGTAWSDRIILDGVPYHPGIVNRIRVADVDGSSTTDVMWGNGRSYQYLDFTGGIQPRLLVSVENGMGKRSEITYRSTTAYAAEAREAGSPWTSFSPFAAQVVSSSIVTDGLGGRYATQYKYRNAYYDGWEAEFRGFGEAEVKTVGDANSPTSVAITRFEPGLMPAWACAGLPLGMLDSECRFIENPLESLKGAVTSTETCDESRTICQGAATSRYSVRRLYQPLGSERSVWYAYARDSYSWVYDTSVLPSGTEPNTLGGYDIYGGPSETGAPLGAGAWSLDVKTFGPGQRYRLQSSVSDIDFWGNVGTTANLGAVELTGDEVTTHATYDAALISGLYIHRVSESWTDPESGSDRLVDTVTQYPGSGTCGHLPSVVRVLGSNPWAWDTGRPGGDPASLSYVRSNVLYDAGRFCQPVQTCSGGMCSGSPLGQARVGYDTAYATSPIWEEIDTSHPGWTAWLPWSALTTEATWYAEYGAIRTVTDPSGLMTSVTLDRLGRPVRMYRPGCAEPAAAILYALGSPISYVQTVTNENCGDSGDEVSGIGTGLGAVMQAYAYVDGLGRARGAIAEGSASDGIPWILSGYQLFDAKGAVQRAYLASSISSPSAFSPARPPVAMFARSAYDAFGRVTRAWTTDGAEVVATRYGALVTDIWDAGDLAPGLYHATPATTYTDGLGRTVRTVERNRSEDDPTVEVFATELEYNPLGAVTVMTRGAVTGDQRDSAFVSDESVVKVQMYDTLGRRVENHDPDAGLYRYAYDAVDRLIATKDARSVINRYWYDRGGRLVAEDLGGEAPYEPASWVSTSTCVLDDLNLPVSGQTCFDILYGFDAPCPRTGAAWEGVLLPSQGPLAGRPSWTKDRSGTVVLGYDDHGWAVWSVRQINPDVTNGYRSLSTFDEGQRLLREEHPDHSFFEFVHTSRGLLFSSYFTDVTPAGPVDQPLIRETYYDAQGRRVSVEYGDRFCPDPSDPSTCPSADVAEGTVETYAYDARQRLSRKRSVRSDGLVLLDYRYSYDSASNIIRIDDGRAACWVAGETSIDPSTACPDAGDADRFVTYDISYSYDALYRLTEADPLYKLPEPGRVKTQTWSFDSLGSMLTWDDPEHHFYGWSLGDIVNGVQMPADPGLGPLPEGAAPDGTPCRVDILGRCVRDRDGVPAPHALYEARSRDGRDELRAYYDAAGNMAALVVHRPDGCGREAEFGGPDGNGCKEGPDFALFFAWDEVGNLLAADRRTPHVLDPAEPSPGSDCSLDPSPEDFLTTDPAKVVWWCPAARIENSYDFGNQRRVKSETYFDGNPFDMAEGYSLYVSGNFEVRDAGLTGGVYDGMGARYARDGLATTWELDAEAPGGGDTAKYRLTLTNHLSSIGLVLDGEVGSALRHFSQLPYGAEEKLVAPEGPGTEDLGRYEFTGKERDCTLAAVYVGARFLSPALGRWLTPDPLPLHSPAAVDNPYRFALSRPSTVVDPNGLQPATPEVLVVLNTQGMSRPKAKALTALANQIAADINELGRATARVVRAGAAAQAIADAQQLAAAVYLGHTSKVGAAIESNLSQLNDATARAAAQWRVGNRPNPSFSVVQIACYSGLADPIPSAQRRFGLLYASGTTRVMTLSYGTDKRYPSYGAVSEVMPWEPVEFRYAPAQDEKYSRLSEPARQALGDPAREYLSGLGVPLATNTYREVVQRHLVACAGGGDLSACRGALEAMVGREGERGAMAAEVDEEMIGDVMMQFGGQGTTGGPAGSEQVTDQQR